MGSTIKINHILKLSTEGGMPHDLMVGGRYPFILAGERIFQFHPTRVTLVHDVDGKWRILGQAYVMKQTIDAERHLTTGEFVVIRLFPEAFARLASYYEAPDGDSYYGLDEIEL